jgi:hypothetical protein
MSNHDVVANFDGKQDGPPASRIIDTLAQNAARGRKNLRQTRRQIGKRYGRRDQRIKLRIAVQARLLRGEWCVQLPRCEGATLLTWLEISRKRRL